MQREGLNERIIGKYPRESPAKIRIGVRLARLVLAFGLRERNLVCVCVCVSLDKENGKIK